MWPCVSMTDPLPVPARPSESNEPKRVREDVMKATPGAAIGLDVVLLVGRDRRVGDRGRRRGRARRRQPAHSEVRERENECGEEGRQQGYPGDAACRKLIHLLLPFVRSKTSLAGKRLTLLP